MNQKNKFFTATMLLLCTVLAMSCEKEADPDRVVNNITNVNPPTPGIDYTLDTTVRLNYTIVLVNGSENSIGFGKKATSTGLDNAKVTITQAGNTITKLTDENGIASFEGFFKGVLTVSVIKDDFTKIKYLVTVNSAAGQVNAGKVHVANLIPIFKVKNDPLTATIAGKATYESDLTNTTREVVPAGTKILASIDASSPAFYNQYLKMTSPYLLDSLQGGKIVSFSYQTAFYDTTDASGNYKITIPASVDGLPFIITAPDLVSSQKYYENATVSGFNQAKVSRTIYSSSQFPSNIPPAGGAEVTFLSGSGAQASANVSGTGQIDKININNGGSGYVSVPKVLISGGGGSGATATAVLTNGVVTSIVINNGGNGYTSNPTVNIISGSGANIIASIGGGSGVILVQVVNSGSGYTTTPNVTISSPTLTNGIQATAIANFSNGRVSSITITNPGSGYASDPIITIASPTSGVTATANAYYGGNSVQSTTILNGGFDFTGNPVVTFSEPGLPNGVRAQGIANVDVNTGIITGFTITNPGSGYYFSPSITLSAGSGASATASYSGKILTGIAVNSPGVDYTAPPKVVITGGGGSGATATSIISNGKVVGFNITNAGSGYTSAPNIELVSGSGAQASVIVSEGKISSINLVNGGSGYTGSPRLVIESNPIGNDAPGSGATATATVDPATGAVTGIIITNQGIGYLGGNVPSVAVPFSITPASDIQAKSGMIYIKDVYFGTGLRVE